MSVERAAAELEAAASAPVLQTGRFKSPVVIASIEVLERAGHYFVRTRSTDGAEGLAVTTERMAYLHLLLAQCVAPAFIGQDARNLDGLIERAYVYRSNYKLAGLALWCCVAWIELSLLDLLGKAAGAPVGELLGGVVRSEVPIYVASGRRETTPEQEVEGLQQAVAETGAKAVKFKLGGRMSQDADSLPGRSEALIRLARAGLGDDMAIHADANGSYSVPEAIRIGRLLEEIGAFFYEEPCPFDHLEETKSVADALAIPVAGGEQETSLRRFRWLIENDGVQVVQPDVQYNGGLIRTIRVARMAERAGVPTTLHISKASVSDLVQFAPRGPCRRPCIGPTQTSPSCRAPVRFAARFARRGAP